jgi:hypothetical protein
LKNKKAFILAAFLSTALLQAQTNISLQTISNYKQWKWDAIVMQNDLITVATVPVIGGRVMQYDLDSLQSIYINSAELGKTYAPSSGAYHNFGGYKTWPSPQSRWPNTWPPPPTLDFGVYTFQADSISNDSVSVIVTSPIENWVAKDIRFVRKATIYPGTSRVKMEQTMINTGTSTANWGMWSITQSIVNHPGKKDYQNYWAYFPINPNSVYEQSGVSPQGPSSAWKGEVAPGVYGVQFASDNQKIYSDPHKGWIAYTSLSDTVVFARTFDLFEDAQYPDDARVTVYVSGASALYMEVEVKSPIVDLSSGGGSYTFTENWWAAKVRAPILEVNSVGAIANRLSYNSATQILSAIYGVFHEGTAKVVFLDINSQILSEGQQHTVSPLAELQIQETIAIPTGAKTVEVQIRNEKGDYIGIVDSADVSKLQTSVDLKTTDQPLVYNLSHNYPNPFNPTTSINFSVPLRGLVSLKVYNLLGRQVAVLINRILAPGTYRTSFDGSHLTSGVYFYRLEAGNFRETHKLVLLK